MWHPTGTGPGYLTDTYTVGEWQYALEMPMDLNGHAASTGSASLYRVNDTA